MIAPDVGDDRQGCIRAPRSSDGAEKSAVIIKGGAGIVRATINRPASRNAIDLAVIAGLRNALELAVLLKAKVLVLRGAEGTFSSGADLNYVSSIRCDKVALEHYIRDLGEVLNGLERGPFTSLAVIEGYALAGGCEILLACDIAVATEDAMIGDHHLEFALLPGAGGSVRLMRKLTGARARYLLLSGESISGRTAADWGLVTFSVPATQLDRTVETLITRLGVGSREAVATAKKLLMDAQDLRLGEALQVERTVFLEHLSASHDVEEGINAFLQKRQPDFPSSQRI